MKQILSSLFFSLLFVNFSYSQVTGEQFAPDNTHWSAYGGPRVSYTMCNISYENLYIKGDTIINNKYCQKLFSSNSHYFDTTCMHFDRYMYYYKKKLYTDPTISIDTNSNLQYDFNLNVGDTFSIYVQDVICSSYNGYYNETVGSVDSMYYGNKWRKRIVFQHNFNFGSYPLRWVEGIGDIDHGLWFKSNLYGFIEFAFCTSCLVNFSCYQEPGFASFGNSCATSSCAPTGNEINDKSSFVVSPNPANNNISITGINSKTTIKIFDVFGRLVLSKEIERDTSIDVQNLSQGIYTLKSESNINRTYNKVVIVKE